MQIPVETFLTVVALVVVPNLTSCSSSDSNGDPSDSGMPDSGENVGGASGRGSVDAASDAAGGRAVRDASPRPEAGERDGANIEAGDASSTNPLEAGACYGDIGWLETEADSEAVSPCSSLPYATDDCTDPDAGIGGQVSPLGYELCSFLELDTRPGVLSALIDCLTAIDESESCGERHGAAVAACFHLVTANACERSVPDAGVDPCETVRASCDEVEAEDCRNVFNAFTEVGQGIILSCFAANPLDAGSCDQAFYNCFLPQRLRP